MEPHQNIKYRKKHTTNTISTPLRNSNHANRTQLKRFQSSTLISIQYTLTQSQTYHP